MTTETKPKFRISATVLRRILDGIHKSRPAAAEGAKKKSEKIRVERGLHRYLYSAYLSELHCLAASYASQKQASGGKMSDGDCIEHVLRYDPDLYVLLPSLQKALQDVAEYRDAKAAGGKVGKPAALLHPRFTHMVKGAIVAARTAKGADKVRVPSELLYLFLFLLDSFFLRMATGAYQVSQLSNRRTVFLRDLEETLRNMMPPGTDIQKVFFGYVEAEQEADAAPKKKEAGKKKDAKAPAKEKKEKPAAKEKKAATAAAK